MWPFRKKLYTQEEIDSFEKETQLWWVEVTKDMGTTNIVINNSLRARAIMDELHRRNKKLLKMIKKKKEGKK